MFDIIPNPTLPSAVQNLYMTGCAALAGLKGAAGEVCSGLSPAVLMVGVQCAVLASTVEESY